MGIFWEINQKYLKTNDFRPETQYPIIEIARLAAFKTAEFVDFEILNWRLNAFKVYRPFQSPVLSLGFLRLVMGRVQRSKETVVQKRQRKKREHDLKFAHMRGMIEAGAANKTIMQRHGVSLNTVKREKRKMKKGLPVERAVVRPEFVRHPSVRTDAL